MILNNWCIRITLGFCLIVFVSWVVPAASEQGVTSSTLEYTVVEVRPGDHCVVSGKPLGPDDICLLINGRRVPLKKEALKIFLEEKNCLNKKLYKIIFDRIEY